MGAFNFDGNRSKLILLFVLNKMDIPLTESTIIEICTSQNDWLSYMECKDIMWGLKEKGFIEYEEPLTEESIVKITLNGIACLSHFYRMIPADLRESVSKFVQSERMNIKKSQEYQSDYTRLPCGNYRVNLKIKDATAGGNLLELNFKTRERSSAMAATKKWREKAPSAYAFVVENLGEDL